MAPDSAKQEYKNECNRCDKIWYVGVEEIESLEEKIDEEYKFRKSMSKTNFLMAILNPSFSMQTSQTQEIRNLAIKEMEDELEKKKKCPNCNSGDISREKVDYEVNNK